ncbi:CDK5 and ABL1 enzyme substrate 2-like isoform X2 [Sinocyclocheilus anshuiensis]|uniref:CDK5 and ABL1 enzyme substrate 2-like isoform X2 n=1 Tax=Sinocyclocheilus anshuiensis TaxID=1608454 RepID=UPI0007BAAE09|nr:PREDICTED: CDK5 and ABL1 enzyme substrate 2-like isoform X2 [Sinocyclocheilus anshuiensis]
MAAAACGTRGCPRTNSAKPHKEHLRKSRDSRRRQAALLFLTNISLDGRPVYDLSNGIVGPREAESLCVDVGAAAVTDPPLATPISYGTFTQVSSISEGAATPLLRTNTYPGPLSPPPAFIQGSCDVFTEDGRTHSLSVQAPPLSPTCGPLNPFSGSSKSPSQFPGSNPVPDPRQRTRNLSGSPGPKVSKKVHFIKNMRQYDTRGSRVVLICAKRSLCAAFSVLPYGESYHISDSKLEAQRQRHSSGGGVDMVPGLEGVEVDFGKTVSYARFLLPTNALVRQKSSGPPDISTAQMPVSRNRINGQKNFTPSRINSAAGQDTCVLHGVDELSDYDPNLLSDPQWPCGKHKRVLIFASYVTTVIEYVKPSDLKKDMNETFKEKFPHIKLTLSKIRSLKREMRTVSEECGLQPVTIAMAYVYFEKLVLQGRLNKHNRKLVSAACVLLAAKISSDLKKQEVKQLIDRLEERFRINSKELISLEFTVLVALEMALYLPDSKVMPHYRRLVQQG